MPKSKPCFKILGKKAFICHLETQENQIGSIFKFEIKNGVKFQKKIAPCPLFHPHHPLIVKYCQGVVGVEGAIFLR